MQRMRSIFMALLLAFALFGCSPEADAQPSDMELRAEETISPNEAFVEDEADVVEYTVEVYQGEDNGILVRATSNSAFFAPLQYEVEHDQKISESDVSVEWTTLMGDPIPSEDDQLAIAVVSIADEGDTFCQLKISLVNKAIEMIVDATKQ